MQRRILLAGLLGGPSLGLVGGCGFELRRAPVLPFERIQLSGFAPRSPLADELARELGRSARVVQANERPEVVLSASIDRRDKAIVAATAAKSAFE